MTEKNYEMALEADREEWGITIEMWLRMKFQRLLELKTSLEVIQF